VQTNEFKSTVETVEQLVRDIGYTDTTQQDVSPPGTGESSNDQTRRTAIFVNTDVGPDFVVSADETERYFDVQSSYALWIEIASALSETRVVGLVPDDIAAEVPDDHPAGMYAPEEILNDDDLRRPVLAAFELLNDVDREVRKDIVYQLTEIFTNANVRHVVDSPSESGAVHEFTVFYRCFPYEEDFEIRRLNATVERVRMATHRGTLFPRYVFDLGVDISKATAGEVVDPTIPSRDVDPSGITDESIRSDE
jgi:hypothetical protein